MAFRLPSGSAPTRDLAWCVCHLIVCGTQPFFLRARVAHERRRTDSTPSISQGGSVTSGAVATLSCQLSPPPCGKLVAVFFITEDILLDRPLRDELRGWFGTRTVWRLFGCSSILYAVLGDPIVLGHPRWSHRLPRLRQLAIDTGAYHPLDDSETGFVSGLPRGTRWLEPNEFVSR